MKILKNHAKSEKGFSLLEVLCAAAIISIVSISFVTLFSKSLLINKQLLQQNRALYYTQARIEALKSLSYQELKNMIDKSPIIEEPKNDFDMRITRVIKIEKGLIKIIVTVKCHQKEMELVTLKAQR